MQKAISNSDCVLVTYPDGSFRKTTVEELREYFSRKGESKKWQTAFFSELTATLFYQGQFACYSIIEG